VNITLESNPEDLVKLKTPSGLSFAPSVKAMVSSLFNPGGTDSGFYRVKAGGILFCRGNGEPWFFYVANRHGEFFPVSCGKQSDGRTVYFHALSSNDDELTGFGSMGMNATGEFVKEQVTKLR